MEPYSIAGPSLVFKVSATVLFAAGAAGLLLVPGLASLVFGGLAVLVAWRLLSVFVSLEGRELVVRNTWGVKRFPIDEIDVRARVVDPRLERYFAGKRGELPTAADDNTVQVAKWYELAQGEEIHSIDALAGRSPANHERIALELRRQILAERGTKPGPSSGF